METVNTTNLQDLRFLEQIEQFDASFDNPKNPNFPAKNKRQSPSSLQELPSSKRAASHSDGGFRKLQLPCPFPNKTDHSSPPLLRRTISEPPVVQESSPARVRNPLLHRTASDPSPVSNGIPPRVPKKSGPGCAESPDAQRLKRIRERMKEMKQWWNEVVREDDDEEEKDADDRDDGSAKLEKYGADNDNDNPKVDNCNDQAVTAIEEQLGQSQEAVWVEKVNGDSLVLHFKCPCGSVYQILLSGNNCYYKLTNL